MDLPHPRTDLLARNGHRPTRSTTMHNTLEDRTVRLLRQSAQPALPLDTICQELAGETGNWIDKANLLARLRRRPDMFLVLDAAPLALTHHHWPPELRHDLEFALEQAGLTHPPEIVLIAPPPAGRIDCEVPPASTGVGATISQLFASITTLCQALHAEPTAHPALAEAIRDARMLSTALLELDDDSACASP
jgi:hypothetical protein